MAELRATPMSNPILGLLADRLKKAQQFGAKPFGYENPPVEMLMNLLGVPAVQQTMERMAYGEPLTTGSGMTTKPRPEAIEAAMTLLPASVGLARATKGLPVGASIKEVGKDVLESKIPSPKSLTMPDVPTVEQMKKHGRVETVPLSEVVSFQSARNWEKFNKGEHAGDLVKGYGDKPLALRLETGEYVIYDGNHRTDLAMQAGKTELPMNVIDVKSYDPAHAGRKPVPSKISDDELLKSLLEDLPKKSAPRQEALDTAQRNAALPVEEGGLGLPKDNTPEMRAEAMGYKTPAYHGTNVWEAEDGRKLGDIEAFNRLASTEIVGRKPSIDQMGIWASDRPDASGAGMYSGSQGAIYPLMLRMENPKATSFEQMARTASNLSTNKALGAGEVPRVSDVEPYRQRLKEQGYDSLMLRAKEGSPYTEFVDQTGYVLLEPNQVRSRFAAFDPKRRNEADILAGVLPLGLLADEEQRKKLYELMPSLLGQ